MQVYTEEGVRVHDFIGLWYNGQCAPQPVYVEIRGKETIIDYDGEIGNGIPESVWHERVLRLNLSDNVYSQALCDKILKELESDIDLLLESYEEKWDGNNHVGSWNEDLRKALEEKVKLYESDCFFVQCGKHENKQNGIKR